MNIHLYPFTGCFGAHRGTLVLTSTHVHIYKYIFFFAILQPEANPAAAACKVPALSSVVGTDCRNIYIYVIVASTLFFSFNPPPGPPLAAGPEDSPRYRRAHSAPRRLERWSSRQPWRAPGGDGHRSPRPSWPKVGPVPSERGAAVATSNLW